MMFERSLRFPPSLRATLVIDAAFEIMVGAALLAYSRTIGEWFGLSAPIISAAGVIFVAAGVAISYVLRGSSPDRRVVRALARANLVGGTVGWIVLLVAWTFIEPEGRWLLGAAADAFVLIGVLELVALRGVRPSGAFD